MESIEQRDELGTEECLLVDVRTPGEFASTWIPGSTNIPLGDLEGAIETLRARAAEGPLLLICRTGNRALKAKQLLEKEGITNIRLLPGGVEAWRATGKPLATGTGSGLSLERQVRIGAGALVMLGVALTLAVHPLFALLPGFVGAGLVFAGITDTCGMTMLLARMPWNRGSGSAPSRSSTSAAP